MVNRAVRKVTRVILENENIQVLELNKDEKAYNYTCFTGKVGVNDEVLVNTTAVDLNLGSGGYHFVIAKYPFASKKDLSPGHIIKLRYTPLQLRTYPIEEQLGEELDKVSLKDTVVITAELHSMLAPIALAIKKLKPQYKIAYVMTDGGSLSASHSKAATLLKESNIIEGVVTSGHSFGGDIEAINPVSAIQGAKAAFEADVIIVCMGPGIVGTGTEMGFTGIEQSYISDLAQKLGCKVYPAVRIGFVDERKRHNGISHHFLTNFGKLCGGKYTIILPRLTRERMNLLLNQLTEYGIKQKHHLAVANGVDIQNISELCKINLSTMGRGYNENKSFFDSLTALGGYVTKLMGSRL
ncbi:DUF3866 family protein [Proteinivorax hydrogeniformans]|uniref:DUF3866 family protein n=1 Tax=Proteinivorax hydrogeniformans TaxID=1826727 RepID=A0AAU8HQA1_9FIRM